MLGVAGEKKPAAQFKDMAELMEELAEKAERMESSATSEAVQQLTMMVAQMAESMKVATAQIAEQMANAKPPTVNVPAPDNRALMRAVEKLQPGAPCSYRFSVVSRDDNGRISEAVLRPEGR